MMPVEQPGPNLHIPAPRQNPDGTSPGRRRWPCLAILLTLAAAAPPPIVARAGSATLTANDVRALLVALPPDARARIGTDPAALAELARTAMVDTLLFSQAHAKGWDRRPEIAAAAERARRTEIVRSFVAGEIPPPPPPTDAQLQPLYDINKPRLMLPRQYHLSQLFLAVPASAAPALAEQTRQELAAIRAQCDGKPDAFANAAKHVSDDKRSAANGGDLGWIAEDKLVAPIRSTVAGMQVGGLGGPIRTDDGWHLLELTGTQAAGPASFGQARPALIQAYVQQQTQAATRAYIDQVLKRDPVELNEPALQALSGEAGGSEAGAR